MPIRIQRKRTKGYKMPCNIIYVGRGTVWGNPFAIGKDNIFHRIPNDNVGAVALFEDMLADKEMRDKFNYPTNEEIIKHLKGKNLACWCTLDKPCHADVLMRIANKE